MSTKFYDQHCVKDAKCEMPIANPKTILAGKPYKEHVVPMKDRARLSSGSATSSEKNNMLFTQPLYPWDHQAGVTTALL